MAERQLAYLAILGNNVKVAPVALLSWIQAFVTKWLPRPQATCIESYKI